MSAAQSLWKIERDASLVFARSRGYRFAVRLSDLKSLSAKAEYGYDPAPSTRCMAVTYMIQNSL